MNADEGQHRQGGCSPECPAPADVTKQITSKEHFLGDACLREQSWKKRDPARIEEKGISLARTKTRATIHRTIATPLAATMPAARG